MRVALSLLALLTAGCAGSVTRNLAFQAPPGWIHTAGLSGADNWFELKTKEFIAAREVPDPRPLKPAIGEARTAIEICGFHAAFFGQGTLTSGQEAEYVDTDWDGKRYMAVYVRPAGTPANPAAEAALRTLCRR